MSSNSKKRSLGRPSDLLGPDDGIDPKLLFRPTRRRDDRGARRLCAQVHDLLILALADRRDAILQSLLVTSVEPAPDATRLAVRVQPPSDADFGDVRRRLALAAGVLRTEVAQAIRRRRAPELVFLVVPREVTP
jgi:ribosome-binding factor A